MNLDFSEEQEMLRAMAREFLSKECPKALVRQMEEDEKGMPRDLWAKMADLGWLGLVFPEKYGGSGGSFLDLAILLEEMGRVLLPGPFLSTVVLCGLPVLEAGSERQKRDLLTGIARGDMVMSLALTEPSAQYTPGAITVSASTVRDGYSIKGTKLFVSDALAADYFLVAARTKENLASDGVSRRGSPKGRSPFEINSSPSPCEGEGDKGGEVPRQAPEEGISLLLVDARSQGIRCTPLVTIAADRQCEVVFDAVRANKGDVVGEVDRGWPVVDRLLQKAALAKCAEMLGGAQQVLEMTSSYVKERVQYGKPIGVNQAIQHRLADIWIGVNLGRSLVYRAAWQVAGGALPGKDISMAKAWLSNLYVRATEEGVSFHGAIGTSREHDMGLYYRRAKAAELAFGDAQFHEEKVAGEILSACPVALPL